ncbi:MAG: hypothetical protein ACM3SP_00565 [Chloroflexota bacterium]
MKAPIAVLLLFLSAKAAYSFPDSWLLTTPEFAITETQITPTKRWMMLESFATVSQCNDRRSSLIKQIDKERREFRDAQDDNAALKTGRELKLLWYIYTYSKCVSSLSRDMDFQNSMSSIKR